MVYGRSLPGRDGVALRRIARVRHQHSLRPGGTDGPHTHSKGQTIFITEGTGLARRHGGPVKIVHPGDRVFFEPGEEHWHGAAPERMVTHVAALARDIDGNDATWLHPVSDEEYIGDTG